MAKGQARPLPSSCLGMMWKWTWNTDWYAASPLFCRTLKSRAPDAARTALEILGRTLPTAAEASSDSSSSEAHCSLGTTRVWPTLQGLMSKKEKTCSSSYTLWQGISPWMISVKMLGSGLAMLSLRANYGLGEGQHPL